MLIYSGVGFINFFFLNSVRNVIYNILMCCDIKIEHLMNGELLNNMLK